MTLTSANGELHCVPAVHFRFAFAQHVHARCNAAATRPDAIAVELGPRTAAAARAWVEEFAGIASPTGKFPCMLGLVGPNRRIHPSRREIAERLQVESGRELHELEPEVLKEHLGYSSSRVLFLSPVDSIIEAIRCAVELNLPLYGVDLDETADAERTQYMMYDPSLASGQVAEYVSRQEQYAVQHRDIEVDSRREAAMAARLQVIQQLHPRVLFTGGLAHWRPLRHLLTESTDLCANPPAIESREIQPDEFQRVIVHPLLAVRHMDQFPALVRRYDSRRPRVDVRQDELDAEDTRIDAADILQKALHAAYEKHFGRSQDIEDQLARLQEDWEAKADFEQLLANYCRVTQQYVPDIISLLSIAQGVMSDEFCRVLAEILMHFDWATPEQFCGLPILAPSAIQTGSHLRVEYVSPDGKYSKYFFIDPRPGGGRYDVRIPIPWQWKDVAPPPTKTAGANRSWVPRDYLTTALTFRASEIATAEQETRQTTPFEGSLLDGVDVKSTLRSFIRGDDRIQVRDIRRPRRRNAFKTSNPFPVVWIFHPGTDERYTWFPFGDSLQDLSIQLDDPQPLREMSARFGDWMTEGFAYVHEHGLASMPEDRSREIRQLDLRGLLLYMPGHFEFPQYAAWANQFADRESERQVPFPLRPVGDDTFQTLGEQHGLRFDGEDWPEMLVRAAIPYALRAVTVILPDKLTLSRRVYQDAAARGISINSVPLSYFPKELLTKVSTYYFVSTTPSGSGNDYPDNLTRILGESSTEYRDWVPSAWLKFGLEPGTPPLVQFA